MRILVTNDDGITAPGLALAEEVATEIAGPDGEVWVVAPEMEQSGVGHCISFVKPVRITQLAERRFMVEGSPADCVIIALGHLMAEAPADLVLSGINRGRNSAEDSMYSGTLGGAMEGALQGVRAIGLSQAYSARERDPKTESFWSASRAWGTRVVRSLVEGVDWEPDLFFSVNFPACPAEEVKGIKAAPSGRREGPPFKPSLSQAPNGRTYYWLAHGVSGRDSREGGDDRAHDEGWVAVTPMRPDLTAHDRLEATRQAVEYLQG